MHDAAAPTTDLPSAAAGPRSPRLPLVIYVLAMGTFLMLTTEFVVAGILPSIASDVGVSVARTGMLITVFAVGMIGAPLMAMLTLRLPHRLTLMLALGLFAVGHVIVAINSHFGVLVAARFLTALATGAFWALAAVVASRVAEPGTQSRAVGVVNAGGSLATVLGVPLGALAAQVVGWRGTFWALAVLAVATVPVIARHVPGHDGETLAVSIRSVSIRSELTALRSSRMWLALAACATTTGGVLAAYSFITPLLTDHAGIASNMVPLVLAGFGVGSLVGSIVGGRLGDTRPHLATIVAPAVTTLVLVSICVVSQAAVQTAGLIVMMGFFGLGANPILISLAVRFADHAPTLGSSLAVASFNFGTAVSSWLGAMALESGLGTVGPVVVGSFLSAFTLVPAVALAVAVRRDQRAEDPHHHTLTTPANDHRLDDELAVACSSS
jgi:predicted MFS family arabinose efflux permease